MVQGKTILIVDDEQSIRETLSLYLNNLGYTAMTALNGAEAAKICNNVQVELVITDMLMSEKDGIEFIKELKNCFPKMPVIAISGMHHLLSIAKMLKVDYILKKPLKFDDLHEALQQTIEKSDN